MLKQRIKQNQKFKQSAKRHRKNIGIQIYQREWEPFGSELIDDADNNDDDIYVKEDPVEKQIKKKLDFILFLGI